MIVNFYSSTPASVLCGRDGCVCVYSLYKVFFSCSCLVHLEYEKPLGFSTNFVTALWSDSGPTWHAR